MKELSPSFGVTHARRQRGLVSRYSRLEDCPNRGGLPRLEELAVEVQVRPRVPVPETVRLLPSHRDVAETSRVSPHTLDHSAGTELRMIEARREAAVPVVFWYRDGNECFSVPPPQATSAGAVVLAAVSRRPVRSAHRSNTTEPNGGMLLSSARIVVRASQRSGVRTQKHTRT